MERIRKWMTILAITGTVLTTGLFCYMPFHEIIKENRGKTVSIGSGASFGDVEDEPREPAERMPQTASGKVPAESAGKGSREFSPVLFALKSAESEFRTSLWFDGKGTGYVFLPGFARDGELLVEEIKDGGFFSIGKESFRAGDTLCDIVWETAYEFVLYDGEGEECVRSPLIFIHSSAIPVLSLSTESESMEWIHAEKGNEEKGEVTLWGEEGELLYQGRAKSIQGRGNSTWGLAKKPYRLKLAQGADFFGFGENKNWILLAEGYDETKLRNRIAAGLAGALDMSFVPEGRPVDLYCNDCYCGVYYLCEKVEIGEGRLEIRDMEENALAAYTDSQLEELEVITSQDGSRKWTALQVEGEDITGGYLIERELSFRYEEEVSGFVTSCGDAYALQSPKYATEEQVNYIADRMQALEDALGQGDGRDPGSGKHYSELIDMESFVQKYLVEEITKNYDGGVTSSFFYKPSDAVSDRIYAGPVWDYDVIFGNCSLDGMAGDPMGITRLDDHVLGTRLFAMLCEQEDFEEQALKMYEQKAAPYLEWLLEEGISALSQETRQAVRLDSIRWEALENRYQYYESYENNVRALVSYIEARKKFLDEVWLSGMRYHTVTFMVDGEPWKKIYVEDGQTAGRDPVPVRHNSLFAGWFSEKHDVPYDEYKPVYEDMSFYAVWKEFPEDEQP